MKVITLFFLQTFNRPPKHYWPDPANTESPYTYTNTLVLPRWLIQRLDRIRNLIFPEKPCFPSGNRRFFTYFFPILAPPALTKKASSGRHISARRVIF